MENQVSLSEVQEVSPEVNEMCENIRFQANNEPEPDPLLTLEALASVQVDRIRLDALKHEGLRYMRLHLRSGVMVVDPFSDQGARRILNVLKSPRFVNVVMWTWTRMYVQAALKAKQQDNQ